MTSGALTSGARIIDMEVIARLVNLAFVLLAALGITLGVIASMKCFGARPGFRHGALVGGLFTFLVSVMVGHLIAGRTEEDDRDRSGGSAGGRDRMLLRCLRDE